MSETSHVRAAATASRLIAKHGRAMQLRSIVTSGPEYNPTITTSDKAITGCMMLYSAIELSSSLIAAGDKKVLVDSTEEITTAHKLVDNSIVYEIKNVNEIKPGDVSIMYDLQVRR
jgi:hypothetical protein